MNSPIAIENLNSIEFKLSNDLAAGLPGADSLGELCISHSNVQYLPPEDMELTVWESCVLATAMFSISLLRTFFRRWGRDNHAELTAGRGSCGMAERKGDDHAELMPKFSEQKASVS